ncbi:Hypothetical protein R9X50_00337500 [Acrodontium crateriforme]|uniref:PNPLA domain-containing protein n=1 Tax=Acrodontium crateriforme TaxID=150365 RepID=A0AAQ3R469_9PEZI|nr:Hypothetical protein R9X50_00337500 [Acrodontium crateriforme]
MTKTPTPSSTPGTPPLARSTGRLSIADIRKASRSSSTPRRAEMDDFEKSGRAWARGVDDAWWPCLLTLDGGGIRGYSSLLIMKALMHEIWLWEQKLDAEEASQIVEEDSKVDSPTDTQQTSGELLRGRPQVADALGNHSEHVEAQFGVSVESSAPENITPSHVQSTIHKDNLTASATVKKALSEEELLPCHYFDFMFGTSTGGLIATMLGRLRMTVSEGLDLYRQVGDDLFGRRRSSIPLMTKYHHEPLEKAVQAIVGARCQEHSKCDGKHDLFPWEAERFDEILARHIPFDVSEPRVCQSCCLTATHDEQISEAYLLRSYPHYYSETAPNWITRYNEGADELPIWKVTRATSAAPFYFEMVTHDFNGEEKSFKDGGIRENNPSGAALSEFHSLYEGKAPTPALLLSVGTGRPDQTQDGFAQTWSGPLGHIPGVAKFLEKRAVVQNLLIKYTEGEKQHHQMREHAHGEHTWYKRLNVSEGLQNMPLDAWVKGEWQGKSNIPGGQSLTHMEDVTDKYLERDFDPKVDSYAPPSVMLKQSAEKLVRQRRAREKMGGVRWQAFVGEYLPKRKDSMVGEES